MRNDLYQFKSDDAYEFARCVNAKVSQKGNELHFQYCPYCHGGKHKDQDTFAINLKTGTWNCKRGSCGQKGSMVKLAQDFDGFSLGDDGIDDYYLKRERFQKYVRPSITSRDEAVEYLKSRGIPEEITRKYEITIKKDTDNVLVFPFMDEKNDMWFVKYRNIKYEKGVSTGSKEWCEPGRKPILFGMNHANFKNSTLVMTEGQIDMLSCIAAGVENVVSVPTGKHGFTWFPHCFNFLGRFDTLIIFGDYENGEISLLNDMKTRFGGQILHVAEEDYLDCKDANEILMKHGAEAIQNCINNAKPIAVDGLKKMKEVHMMKLSDYDRMNTGIKELDQKCPFLFGELIILTGAAGDGKSTLASQWVTQALDQGYAAMIYSGEMLEGQVKAWNVFQMAGAHNLNDQYDVTEETYRQISDWPMYDNLYIYDADDDMDVGDSSEQENIFNTLKLGIRQYGIRFIVIDNMMTAMDYNTGLELNEAQTVFTRRLAKIAQNTGSIIILIVHPRKGTKSNNDDISGSSNIVNRAHKTIWYSRPTEQVTDLNGEVYDKDRLQDCPIRILKVSKDRMTGHTINNGIQLYFDEHSKRISDDGKFDWRLGWEKHDKEEFQVDINDLEIPF